MLTCLFLLKCIRPIHLSPHVILTRNYASHHRSRAPTCLQCCLQLFNGTVDSENTDLFNYVGDNKPCDHDWLKMLLGNAPMSNVLIAPC